MKKRYSISIPKPCHENWLEMIQNEKGRFCQSCSKTVVDFTHMKTNDVQEFIHNNKDQRICAHIRQNQLDAINLQISETVFEQAMSFHKLFLLALLLAMGTSLFSCADDKGNIKKIESVEIIEKVMDSTQIEVKKYVDSTTTHSSKDKTDSKKDNVIQKTTSIVLNGLMIMGNLEEQVQLPIHLDSIIEPQYPEIIEGEMEIQALPHCPGPERKPTDPYNYNEVEFPPMFKDSPKDIDALEKRDYFKNKIADFVSENFQLNPLLCLDLSGKHKIFVQFTIQQNGNTKNVKARGPNLLLEKEAIRVIKLLPQFTPAKHEGKSVDMTYNLPIIFEVKD